MRVVLLFIFLGLLQQGVLAQDKSDCACCKEEHGQFDFWLGKWTVTTPDGKPAGKNEIKKIQDNCILMENWKSARSAYTGTSYNFYNVSTGMWEQVWIDNQGQNLHMRGNREGNKMILRTEDQTNKEGQSFFHRITWTKNEDGSVRQLWETITGDEVSVAFDGLYKRDE